MMSDEDAYDQVEEMQVLESIYGDNIIQYIQGTKSLQLSFHKHHRLCIHIPNDYPSITSPILEFIHTPFTDLEKKQMIIYLNSIHEMSCGQVYLYDLIEYILNHTRVQEVKKDTTVTEKIQKVPTKLLDGDMLPIHIEHGDLLVDRKSTFQAHVSSACNLIQVDRMMKILLQDKKVAKATHNIMAYRIQEGDIWHKDNDDDGERGAGGKLARFLDLTECKNVIVVVSRWYGGIQLGNVRFKHIKTVAQAVLLSAGFIQK